MEQQNENKQKDGEVRPFDALVIQPEKAAKAMEAIRDQCWDLRCESEPIADTGDYSITWVVYEHHMSNPKLRAIGYGDTPMEAINDANNFINGEAI